MTRAAKPTTHSKDAAAFFYKHGGWSWNPKKETKAQGRRRVACKMAVAERYASDHGWRVKWEHSPEPYEMGDAETEMPSEILDAVLFDDKGEVLGSLGSIGDPSREYGRIVEAELALEAMPDIPALKACARSKKASKKRRK